MPKPRNVIPTVEFCLCLPEDLKGWLDLHLYSEMEGRVPLGHYQEFFVRKIREERDWKRLAISPGHYIVGSKEAIEMIERRLASC